MKWRWVSASGGGLVAGTGLLWGDESLITRGTRGSQCVVLCCLPVVAESESSEILNGFSFHCKHKEGVRVKRGGQRRSTPKTINQNSNDCQFQEASVAINQEHYIP